MTEQMTINRTELRQKIISKIMELVSPEKVERPRPTIAELEEILSREEAPNIQINPDGSVVDLQERITTVGKVADAILDLLESADAK